MPDCAPGARNPTNGSATTDPTMIDVFAGRCVKQLRERRGLSRQALGTASGVTGQQIDKYERGANRMSLSRFARIADALATDPMSLLSEAHERGETHIPPVRRNGGPRAASQRVKAAELMRLGLDMDEPLLDHLLALAKATQR